jgi:hypothetical protein
MHVEINVSLTLQGKANIFNVLILYKENLCEGDNIIKKQINRAEKSQYKMPDTHACTHTEANI